VQSSARSRLLIALACVLVLGGLLYALRGVLSPILLAFFIAYLLDPVADRLEALRVPRGVAVSGLLVAALLLVVLLVLLVLPAVIADLAALASQLPAALQRGLEKLGPWLSERGFEMPSTSAEVISSVEEQLSSIAPTLLGSVRGLVSTFAFGTASVVASFAAVVLVPILAAYLLLDFDRIMAATSELIPPRYRGATLDIVREVHGVLGLFVRGQLLVMLILGALLAAGYAAIGVPLAVPIGIVGGLLSFIPYVGGAVALGLGLLMAVLHFDGFGQLLGVVAVYSAIQLLEGFVITPYIVGDKLGLSALVVLFALMVGGELFGFLGVMLALPFAAIIKVFVARWLLRYRASTIFVGAGNAGPVSSAAPRLRLRAPLHGVRRAKRRRQA
jgi:predicted PurR-regulated permease PerM